MNCIDTVTTNYRHEAGLNIMPGEPEGGDGVKKEPRE